ncbi:T9SS type A sorting domain-containing protein [Aquimarina aggregata]|uniref:T9SS type A sorting domain-containing protein n=1 Tax=Aquimarina aggregata TaxID=1642818 RepID=UPI00248F8511|nr:T9SS type A sorting domain-containing protein [Aquimarina aggregata]
MEIKTITQVKMLVLAFVCFVFSPSTLLSQQNPTMTKAAEDLHAYIKHYNQSANKNTISKQRTATSTTTWPKGVNPFNSYFGDNGSYKEWSNYFYNEAQAIKDRTVNKKLKMTVINEVEGDNQSINDTQALAQAIANFGSGTSNNNRINIIGGLTTQTIPELETSITTVDEDNGAIPIATSLDFDGPFKSVTATSTFGDGPHGSAGSGSGDTDFYEVDLKAGDLIEFKASASEGSIVNPVTVPYNAAGQIITFDVSPTPVTSVNFLAPEDGLYYFGLYDFNMLIQLTPATVTPFNSGGGVGIGLEGDYEVEANYFGQTESDFYSFQLKKGDVFGIAVNARSNTTARLFFPNGEQAIGTSGFGNRGVEGSPLPLNGETSLSYIAPETGTYRISINGNIGIYAAEIVAARPGLEINKGQKQIIYLDFTGSDFKQRDFFNVPDSVSVGDPELDKERFLSPFGDFLENWGIENNRLNRTRITADITDVVKENLQRDLIASGINFNFNVEIVSDYGNAILGDRIPKLLEARGVPYGRVIIGGTIEESGIGTIGIANSIDPGNYSLTDEALVLLDVLSDVNPNAGASINNIPRADGVPIEDLVSLVVGNVTAHEIGHYIGNFHTTVTNDVFSIMDEGGNILSLVGIEAGAAFGDPSTVDVDFSQDTYSLRELFEVEGVDLTDVNSAFAFSFFPSFFREKDVLTSNIDALESNVLAKLDKQFPAKVSSYPNPQKRIETSHLIFSSEKSGPAKVVLYNMQGSTVGTIYDGFLGKGENKEILLDPTRYNLTRGIYIYKIQTAEGETNHQIAIK